MIRSKALFASGLIAVASVSAHAQGTIRFDTFVSGSPSVDAKVTDGVGGPAISGAAGFAQLFVGTAANNLVAISSPVNFLTGAGAGYVLAGTVTLPTQAGFAGGNSVFVAVRAWSSSFASYAAAVAGNGKIGSSATLSYTLGGAGSPPSTPGPLVGLANFAIAPVPEPSVIALAGLGLGGLILARRSKKA